MAVISTLKKFAQKYKKHPSRSLLDPDPRGKMTADPDPQPWVIYIIQCTVYTYVHTISATALKQYRLELFLY